MTHESDHTAQITKRRKSQRTTGKATAMKRLLAILLGVALAGPALAASLMPQGKQAYFATSGAPLAGGLLYTYAAGTSTPLATYSDQAGTVPNANPVVLNSRGEATIFWGSGPYKVALYTSAGALLWTQDNLYPPFDAAGPLRLYSGGNATTPELAWLDDTNSGFYLIGEDNIGLSIGGTKRWDFAAAGSTLTGTLTVSGTLTASGAATMGPTTVTSLTATGIVTATTAPVYVSTISATGSNDVEFVSSITVAEDATFLGSTFVPTPVSSTEAASKGYVDAADLTTTAIVAGTNWAVESIPSTSPIQVSKRAGFVTVSAKARATASGGGLSWASVGTIPASYRPNSSQTGVGHCYQATSGNPDMLCTWEIGTNGVISVDFYNTSTLQAISGWTPLINDWLRITATYVQGN